MIGCPGGVMANDLELLMDFFLVFQLFPKLIHEFPIFVLLLLLPLVVLLLIVVVLRERNNNITLG